MKTSTTKFYNTANICLILTLLSMLWFFAAMCRVWSVSTYNTCDMLIVAGAVLGPIFGLIFSLFAFIYGRFWKRIIAIILFVWCLLLHSLIFSQIAIFGYSHGGGTVYNVAWRIHNNFADTNGKTFEKPHTLVFMSYVDAVKNRFYIDMSGENLRPLGSAFHTSQYQENNYFVDGAHANGDADDDIDRSNIVGINHNNIDDNEIVRDFLKTRFKQKVSR